ncbi:hypothetical protein BDP55DRAFT_246475 [Colletotrichum godetiae]|uniref:PH domain-containing protein n=1 Tax=Colletotrichum godetiae TaxID=1209918 RepID=A0AAJ0AIX2_9PEZI|nr:uncharacterized protein BDP55DRAFT_246475 [Colletotrichum godetiae]KAK1672541.1 hypothetical protein BDP55DRAFT_246475 [Colletotrichum godetiae]
MEGFSRINRTMSAGPGPPKSPAPHPPRRGQSVTAGRLTRYRSVREHKSVLDFGRNWRDWEVDIFQDDETVSNATTETGTATSIALGLGIGIAVDEEEESGVAGDDGQTSVSSPHPQYQYQHQQQPQQQQTPASSARRRRTAPLLSTPPPQTPSGAPQLTMQWQWPDLMADTGVSDGSSPFDFDNSSVSRGAVTPGDEGYGANYYCRGGVDAGDGAVGGGKRMAVPAPPESPVRFSYPNRRRPTKTAPKPDLDDSWSPLHGSSSPPFFSSSPPSSSPKSPTTTTTDTRSSPAGGRASCIAGGGSATGTDACGPYGPRPPSEPGSLFSLAPSYSGSTSPAPGVPGVPGVSSTQAAPLYALGPCPSAPSAGSALLPPAPASAADASASAPWSAAPKPNLLVPQPPTPLTTVPPTPPLPVVAAVPVVRAFALAPASASAPAPGEGFQGTAPLEPVTPPPPIPHHPPPPPPPPPPPHSLLHRTQPSPPGLGLGLGLLPLPFPAQGQARVQAQAHHTRARDLVPPPGLHLRPRSHNPILVSSHSSCADLKLAARAEHARSQIITKLALQPDLDNNYYTSNNTNKEELHNSNDPNWDQQLARQEEDRQRRRHQQHHQQLLAQEEEEHRRRKEQEEEDAARWAEEVARLEAETDRILADQKAKDLARLSAQLADQKAKDLARLQAQLAAVPDAPASRVRSPIVDKFTFFLRKGRKSDPATTLTKPPSQYFQPLTLDHRPVSVMDPSRFIQAGGGGIVPQTDAPTSASNAGERRVTIRCMQSSISLPVTPDTTPSEILYSAANLMTHNINPQTSVVLECYFAFGLERRLRRYEPVALVMNSWDRDTQHCLLIVPGEPTDKNPDLNIESVPRTIDPPPGLINFALYHSQRPGKWNKRYVTLLETGQMFSAKKKDAKLSDKDAVSLCHLSDFDLYTVTEKDMLKQIRAPKKNCFAIKSQQKSTVFQNTENFIHFFATDDVKLAEDFQRVVQGWRSWYIANKIVDLNKKKSSTHSSSARSGTKTGGGGLTRSGTLHRPRPSTEETPYTIGTFSPLLDMDRFEKSIDDFGKDLDNKPTARPADHHSTPRHIQSQKVVSRSRTTPNLSQPQTRRLIDPFAKDEFKSGGLLGQAYEGRKQQAEKAAATADHQQYAVDSPFTGGHSLLGQFPEHENNGMPQRRGTVRSSRPTATDPMPQPRSRSRPPAGRPTTSSRPKTSDGGSSSGKREMPQPLVDLTPKVPDLPAAWRDGQGRGVRVPTGKPLIEMATGLELPDGHLGPQLPTVTRMGTAKAYPPQRMASQSAASRPRSRSTAGGGAVRRVVSNEQQPPMPSMPRRSSRRDDDDVPLINFVERERGRDTRPRMSQGMSQGLGRSGTVRH